MLERHQRGNLPYLNEENVIQFPLGAQQNLSENLSNSPIKAQTPSVQGSISQ